MVTDASDTQQKVSGLDEVNNSSIDTSIFTTSTEWIYYGVLQTSNQQEKALESFNKALELDPSNHRALLLKATILIYHFKQYQEVIDIHDKYPEIGQILHKGDAYYALEKYNEAINCYDQIAVDLKDYIYSYYKKGQIYSQFKRI